jgi:protein gp37
MGKNSAIAWTDHTFNPWWGCVEVSPGCANCYAHTLAKRTGNDCFGATAKRRTFGPKHWADPVVWNRNAAASGTRARVFCGSMCDVFEANSELDYWRSRLWDTIDATPWLDWLLLTKRPTGFTWARSAMRPWPSNVWLGVTAENQDTADKRWNLLANENASVRFMSVEPQLGPVSIAGFATLPDWIICGGESGPRARPFDVAWARQIRDECKAAHVACFIKQLGANLYDSAMPCFKPTRDRAHDNPADWPPDLRVREFPRTLSAPEGIR